MMRHKWLILGWLLWIAILVVEFGFMAPTSIEFVITHCVALILTVAVSIPTARLIIDRWT